MGLDDNDKKILTDAFRDALKDAGVGGSGSRFSGSSNQPPPAPSAAPGLAGVPDASNALGVLGKAAGKGAEVIGTVAGAMGDTVKDWQQLSRTGASFNNNAIGMAASISQTRMTMDEYKQVMDKLGPSIAGLGGTVDQGTKNFNKFSGEFMETKFADQLTKMGYTTKELNDVMAANMANRRFTDLTDETQRRKAIESTAELARQFDETAKLTGITRQEQMADLRQRTENGKVQAAIQLEIMKGGKDAEEQYRKMQAGLNGMGKGVKDLADEMFTGGIRTKEGAAKMAALGPAGNELQKAITASKNARTDEEKAAAALQLERAKAAVNERMKSREFLEAVTVAGGDVGPAMQKMYEENKLKDGTTYTENKTGQTTGEAQSTNKALAVNEQQGKDEKGRKDEAAKTTELYVQGLNRQRDISMKAAEGINVLNEALMKIPTGKKMVDTGLAITAAQEPSGKPFGKLSPLEMADRLKLLEGGGGRPTGSTIPGPTGGTTGPGRTQVIPPKPLEGVIEGGKDLIKSSITNWAGNTPGSVDIVKFLGSTTLPTGTPVPGRAAGSKASTGDWFENFGSEKIMALHNKEAVVPEDKLPEFISDMFKKLPGDMSSIMGKLTEVSPKEMPKPVNMDMSGLMKQVTESVPKEASAPKSAMNAEQMDEMMKSMRALKPEELLQFATKGNEQQAEMAKKIYMEMDLATKKANSEDKLKTAETKTSQKLAPTDNPVLELQRKLVEQGAKIKTDGIMGKETMSAIKANMSNLVKEATPKPAAPAPAPAPTAEAPKTEKKAAATVGESTLSDVVKSLDSLNMLMGQLLEHSATSAENSGAAVKATRGLSGNLYNR